MIHGHMLTGQMLTPLSKNGTNAHKIWFWHGKFVNMDIDVIWLITFTARCTIVQSTVLPSLCCTADVMWNAHWVEFTRTDCVSALVRWNTTQIIIFKSSSTPAQLRVISAHLSSHRQWVWVDPVQQYSGDCDQVVVTAGGSTSHVCASVPDYIRTSCVRLRFCRTFC